MSEKKYYWSIVIVALLFTGCASTFTASFDRDPGHDFSGYETFAWIAEHPMKVDAAIGAVSPLLEPRIMSALEKALTAKGFAFSKNLAAADFVLSFTVGSREKIDVDSYPSMGGARGAYPGHWGWGGGYYGYGTETTVRQYTQGMLAVDIFDVKARRPVWHGVASKSIYDSDREDVEGTVNAAVDAVMAGFPPQ